MAMNRAGLKSLMGYQEGGDPSDENTGTPLLPSGIAENFAVYRTLLEQISPPPRQLTGYDLISSLGKGLLEQQKEKLPSMGRGIGLGFQEFKALQDAINEETRKTKLTRDMTAFGLAAKPQPKTTLKSLATYRDDKGNVFQGLIAGDQLIFKGNGETLSEQEFVTKYPNMRPMTEGEFSKGVLDAKAMNDLQIKIGDERNSASKLETYLMNQKDRAVGIQLLADNFVGLVKTAMGENNLSEDQLKKRILDANFQGLIGGFRIETVGPGVMTEFDAQRIVQSLGGEPGALQNPVLVAKVLKQVFERKIERLNTLQGQFNEQVEMGYYPKRELYEEYKFNEDLFKFKPKFPKDATDKKTNDDGSIEYTLGGKRFRIGTDGIKEQIGEGPFDSDIEDLTQ